MNGEGVPEDDAEAVRWFRLAAEQQHASAQFRLGYLYSRGRGVSEDDAEAVRWYQVAAEQGHAEAQSILGRMYANGEGILGRTTNRRGTVRVTNPYRATPDSGLIRLAFDLQRLTPSAAAGIA